MSNRDEAPGCLVALASLLVGIVIGLAIPAERSKTPAQAWVQYVEVKAEHERAYLEGLK